MKPSASTLFRLRKPDTPRNIVPFTPRHFTATLLLEDQWDVDIAAVAVTTVARFPMIGRVGTVRGCTRDAPPTIEIDGANITLRTVREPISPEQATPSRLPSGHWHSALDMPDHVAHLDVSCGGNLPGIEGARAYAAAVHFVATAARVVAPACAVLWRTGRVLSTPAAFEQGADVILGGGVPLDNWVSFATFASHGASPRASTGMLSYGLRPFIGCELELAPRPVSQGAAWRYLSHVARMALDDRLSLTEDQRDEPWRSSLTARSRDSYPIGDGATYLIVADDAAAMAESLEPGCRSA